MLLPLDLNDQPLNLVEQNIDVAIRLGNLSKPLEWIFEDSTGAQSVKINSHYQSNNLLALKDAAIAGTGIARLPLWMVDAEIKAGLLRSILDEVQLPAFGIYAVFPSARQIPAKVSLFVDFIQQELSAIPYFMGARHKAEPTRKKK